MIKEAIPLILLGLYSILSVATESPGKPHRLPVPPPDLKHLERAVREHIDAAQQEFRAFTAMEGISQESLGRAYGELGRVYHAHHLYDPAQTAYRNAEKLVPNAFSWPYLLGYLYQGLGDLKAAAKAYNRALQIQPDYSPLRLRLAEVYLGLNKLEPARSLLRGLLSEPDQKGAAAYGLGKLGLAQGNSDEAVRWLKSALTTHPEASRIHYHLAMAYRGLGNTERARYHLQQRGAVDPPIEDLIVQELENLVSGARTHLYRAMQAVWARQFARAADEFRKVLTLEPNNIQARVSLARALYLLGQRQQARNELSAALKSEPHNPQANYFMGRLIQETVSDELALPYLGRTLDADPAHAGAHYFVANALMRAAQYKQAADHYAELVKQQPEELVPRQLQAIALIAMEHRHEEARARLEEALESYPTDPLLMRTLARLLATSTQDKVRDGERAFALAKRLYETNNSIENAETVAMAYAELGRYAEAIRFQQAAIDVAEQWGGFYLLPRLNANLERYQQSKPARLAWPLDDPIFHPPRGQAADSNIALGKTMPRSAPASPTDDTAPN